MTLRSSAYDRELSHKQSNMTMAAPESCDNEEDGDDQVRSIQPFSTDTFADGWLI